MYNENKEHGEERVMMRANGFVIYGPTATEPTWLAYLDFEGDNSRYEFETLEALAAYCTDDEAKRLSYALITESDGQGYPCIKETQKDNDAEVWRLFSGYPLARIPQGVKVMMRRHLDTQLKDAT